jgi:hypothetical protein
LITLIPAFILDVPAYAITSNEAGAINFKFFRPRAVLRLFDCRGRDPLDTKVDLD